MRSTAYIIDGHGRGDSLAFHLPAVRFASSRRLRVILKRINSTTLLRFLSTPIFLCCSGELSGGAAIKTGSILAQVAKVVDVQNSLEAKQHEHGQLEVETRRLGQLAEQFNNLKLQHDSKVFAQITRGKQ